MQESLPSMVYSRVKEVTKTTVLVYVVDGLILERQKMQVDVTQMVDSFVRSYMSHYILHGHPTQASQASVQEQSFVICLRDQDDPYDDAHPEGENNAKRQKTSEHGTYVFRESSSDDNELVAKKVSQELVEESLKEILTSPFPLKPTPVVQSCQRDPKAPALSLVNQDLLYQKKGNSGPEKFVLSLHKFHAVIVPNDDIKERTSRWVDKCELGHEHKFVTKIIARRANGSIVSITKPDYKNLNKNDIEDMYLLCINGKVDDYTKTRPLWLLSVFIKSTVIWERVHDFQLGVESYQQKVNLTTPTITFPGIEKKNMFSIINEPIYGIIYKNNKKEKREMGH
ncbi:hypothetical protein Tco_0127140 [Tanacetum coccineum]